MSTVSSEVQQMPSSQNIPVRKVVVNDPNQLPLDYGTTPGGTIFSTTPGGTRIVYERKFLMLCRKSPHSMSPPANLPVIPGVTEPDESASKDVIGNNSNTSKENVAPGKQSSTDDQLFQMDI